MSIFKNVTPKEKDQVLVNNAAQKFQEWDRLTLVDLDKKLSLHDVRIGTSEHNGIVMHSLVLLTSTTEYIVPFSRGIDIDKLADENYLTTCKFYFSRKINVNAEDQEAEALEPTGDHYICFGKAGRIKMETKSLIATEVPAGV